MCGEFLPVSVFGKADSDLPATAGWSGRWSFVQSFLDEPVPSTIRQFLCFPA